MKSLVALLNLQMLYEFKRIMHILKNVVVDYKVDTLPLTYDQIFHCFCHPFLAKKNHFLLPTIFYIFWGWHSWMWLPWHERCFCCRRFVLCKIVIKGKIKSFSCIQRRKINKNLIKIMNCNFMLKCVTSTDDFNLTSTPSNIFSWLTKNCASSVLLKEAGFSR